MDNVILFANSFFSYLLLMIILVVIMGAAIFIGIRLRKNKDKKLAEEAAAEAAQKLEAPEK